MIGVIEKIEEGLASDTPSRVEWRTLLETALTEIKEIRHHHDEFVVAATIRMTDQNSEIARLRGVIAEIGQINDRMADLAEKEKEWAQNAVAALKTAEKELTHAVPGSCYSTGPMTGDPIQDLVACPGCAALAKIRAALNIQQRASIEEGKP